MKLKNPLRILSALSTCLVFATALHAQRFLLHYDFNQPLVEGKVQSTHPNAPIGDATSRDGTLTGGATVTNGAFDNTAASGMGAGSTGGNLMFTNGFGGTSSWTVSLWFNAATGGGIGNTARLFSSSDVYLTGLGTPGTGATLQVYAAGQTQINVADPIYSGVSEKWIFVAVTYNGNGTLSLYAGSDTQEAKLIQSVASSFTGNKTLPALTFGANPNGTANPFKGYLDDIRVYAGYDGTTGSGALPLSALEQIRQEGIAQMTIPEPTTAACITGLATFLLAFVGIVARRQRRS